MLSFDRDDVGYLAWLDTNQDGFVVNSNRKPTANYLRLHRATCTSISRTAAEPIRWTSGGYIKTCSVNISDLERWAREVTGGTLTPCGQCRPL